MIGLDSNVLIRHLAQDDPLQSAIATALLSRRLTVAEPGFVSAIALAETVWVLESNYRQSPAVIAAAVESLLLSKVLVVESAPAAFAAMEVLRAGKGEFTDAYLAQRNLVAGCSHTLTFDRKALRLPGFAPA